MHNEQPFYIGQKVVALSEAYLFVKGKVYTVGECFCCSKCGHWHITVIESDASVGVFHCSNCLGMIKNTLHHGRSAKHFAPIVKERSDIRTSLAQDAVQERLDVVKPLVKQKSIT
jgi:hypothetical protein